MRDISNMTYDEIRQMERDEEREEIYRASMTEQDKEREREMEEEKAERQIEEYEREEAEKERLGLKPIEEMILIKPKVEIGVDDEPML